MLLKTRSFFLVLTLLPGLILCDMQVAYGFYVTMKNRAGRQLEVSCTTSGQNGPVTMHPKGGGRDVACNGQNALLWNTNTNDDLRLEGFWMNGGDGAFDDKVTFNFYNHTQYDHSLFCILELRYTGDPYTGYSFSTKNLFKHCTTDYIHGFHEDTDATVHIKYIKS